MKMLLWKNTNEMKEGGKINYFIVKLFPVGAYQLFSLSLHFNLLLQCSKIVEIRVVCAQKGRKYEYNAKRLVE